MDAAVGQTAASIRILLELARECNSAIPSLPRNGSAQKKREVLTEHLPDGAT